MDFINNLSKQAQGGQQQGGEQQQGQEGQQQGGFNLGSTISSLSSGGNLGDKLNSMGGGGAQGEANEDYLDKGVDLAQQYGLGQGQQSNETAAEQAKDEVMSDMIRDKYKGVTGSDFPIQDKEQKYGA